jgi:hypothetical protein
MTDYKKIEDAQRLVAFLLSLAEKDGYTCVFFNELKLIREGLNEAVKYINTTESGGLYCLP